MHCRCSVKSGEDVVWIIDGQAHYFRHSEVIDLGNGDSIVLIDAQDTYVITQLKIHLRDTDINVTCGGGQAILRSAGECAHCVCVCVCVAIIQCYT